MWVVVLSAYVHDPLSRFVAQIKGIGIKDFAKTVTQVQLQLQLFYVCSNSDELQTLSHSTYILHIAQPVPDITAVTGKS